MVETNSKIKDLFKYVKENIDTKRIVKVEDARFRLKDLSLGSQIAYYRKKKNMTQLQLAQKVNMHIDSIKKYENHPIKQIKDVSHLKDIFNILGMTDKVYLSDYYRFVLNNPSKILTEFTKNNNITGKELGRLMGKNAHQVRRWIRGETVMTEENFEILKPILKQMNYEY